MRDRRKGRGSECRERLEHLHSGICERRLNLADKKRYLKHLLDQCRTTLSTPCPAVLATTAETCMIHEWYGFNYNRLSLLSDLRFHEAPEGTTVG